MFFNFLKMSKNHKGYYRVTGQAKFDLMALCKKHTKSEKYRRNSVIAKIPSDSISVGLIYLSHLKNQKSVTCQVRTFWKVSFSKNYLKNSKKIEKMLQSQKCLRIRIEQVRFDIRHLKRGKNKTEIFLTKVEPWFSNYCYAGFYNFIIKHI